jgi:hypothetical protein
MSTFRIGDKVRLKNCPQATGVVVENKNGPGIDTVWVRLDATSTGPVGYDNGFRSADVEPVPSPMPPIEIGMVVEYDSTNGLRRLVKVVGEGLREGRTDIIAVYKPIWKRI